MICSAKTIRAVASLVHSRMWVEILWRIYLNDGPTYVQRFMLF